MTALDVALHLAMVVLASRRCENWTTLHTRSACHSATSTCPVIPNTSTRSSPSVSVETTPPTMVSASNICYPCSRHHHTHRSCQCAINLSWSLQCGMRWNMKLRSKAWESPKQWLLELQGGRADC
ncbi:hypothetical protein EDD16DRAFT_1679698, partial [Pisolithus croceorrhizus]